MWALSGTDVSLGIDYQVDGQFVVPDSATYSVRDFTGTVLTSGSLPALMTSETLLVPLAYNGLTAGSVFENRFVTITFKLGVNTFTQSCNYKLSPFVPTTATPGRVRAELGLEYAELPDADVDVNRAYFDLLDLYPTGFLAAFTMAGARSAAANQAVVLQAALNVAESLDLRAAVITKAENHISTRITGLDFDLIISRLRVKLANQIRLAKAQTATSVVKFVLGTPKDPITG